MSIGFRPVNPHSGQLRSWRQNRVPPVSAVERNFAAAKEPKQFQPNPSGGHGNGLETAGREYELRVGRSFAENLRGFPVRRALCNTSPAFLYSTAGVLWSERWPA